MSVDEQTSLVYHLDYPLDSALTLKGLFSSHNLSLRLRFCRLKECPQKIE